MSIRGKDVFLWYNRVSRAKALSNGQFIEYSPQRADCKHFQTNIKYFFRQIFKKTTVEHCLSSKLGSLYTSFSSHENWGGELCQCRWSWFSIQVPEHVSLNTTLNFFITSMLFVFFLILDLLLSGKMLCWFYLFYQRNFKC